MDQHGIRIYSCAQLAHPSERVGKHVEAVQCDLARTFRLGHHVDLARAAENKRERQMMGLFEHNPVVFEIPQIARTAALLNRSMPCEVPLGLF
jgi:hypothetical protein